ncbi:MAG: ASKHA domain-containing protein [Thermodesulfobacteriota bacterium]
MTTQRKKYGVAFDVGTTSVASALVDIESKKVLATRSLANPQRKWGADVLARVRAVTEEPHLLTELQSAIVGAMNELIAELTEEAGEGEVLEITAAGNSVMEHILVGVSPSSFSRVPYKPAFKEAKIISATEIGINAPAASLYTFPLIGGFIGGDTVSMLLSLALEEKKKTALAIDVGTNSEIVLAHDGVFYGASAAAGPAFEGGGIKHGTYAAPGAIEGVSLSEGEVELTTIGHKEPRGICGSGLTEAVSELIGTGIIESSGRIKDASEVDTNLSSRIKSTGEHGNAFVLFKGPSSEITLDQTDIRNFQTAKSAIRAGINVLLSRADITASDVTEVYIAGAFGANLDKNALERVGVLDSCWHDMIYTVGDAALDGAVIALGSDGARKEAARIAAVTKYVSLSGSPGFEREFISNMNFK